MVYIEIREERGEERMREKDDMESSKEIKEGKKNWQVGIQLGQK
jgi:predicted transposase YdaD